MKYFKLMAMKKFISAASVVLMTAASCTSENASPEVYNGDGVIFTAVFSEAPAAKTVLVPGEKTAAVEWLEGDQVDVFAEGVRYLYVAGAAGAQTTLTSESPAPKADTYYALCTYPYGGESAVAGNVITTVLPSEQTGVKGNFSTHMAVASATGTAMSFKNVCSLVKVNVASDNVTRIEFEGNADETVAGGINVTVSDDPFWTAVEGQGTKVIVMIPASGLETFEQGDYYFAILPQQFSTGFTVTSYKNDGRTVVREVTSDVTVGRGKIVSGKAFGISGQGTEEAPYILETVQDLVDMKDLVVAGQANYFELGADIDMEGVTYWESINSDADAVAEIHLDGKNHTISNFAPTTISGYPSFLGILHGSCRNLNMTEAVLNNSKYASVGILASYVGYHDDTRDLSATVENVNVTGSVVGNKVAGGLGGVAVNATITNCSADVDVTTSGAYPAGFMAQANGNVSFINCHASGNVKSTAGVVGMAGFCGGSSKEDYIADSSVSFEKCYSTGSVTTSSGTSYQGGALVGIAFIDMSFVNCYAKGSTNLGRHFGGILGLVNNDGVSVVIDKCYYEGTIESAYSNSKETNSARIGGVLGYIAAGSATVKNTFSHASITTHSSNYGHIGGIVGYNKGTSLTIENSYAAGTLTAENLGGVLGYTTDNTTTMSNCWYAGTSAEAVCGSGIFTTPEGKENGVINENIPANASAIARILGWDETVWDLNGDSPVLK